MKEIKKDELRTIQLDILQKVHNFCISHNIRYSLAFGTLLGAVRHGGYIPWDDDIDIAMLRHDYERFRIEFKDSVCQFCDCRTDKDIQIGFGKVVDTRTLVIHDGARPCVTPEMISPLVSLVRRVPAATVGFAMVYRWNYR